MLAFYTTAESTLDQVSQQKRCPSSVVRAAKSYQIFDFNTERSARATTTNSKLHRTLFGRGYSPDDLSDSPGVSHENQAVTIHIPIAERLCVRPPTRLVWTIFTT